MTADRASQTLEMLLGGLRAGASEEVIVGRSTVQIWPAGLLSALEQARLLMAIDRAQVVECPGCQKNCIMDVKWTGDEAKLPIVLCNKPQHHGLIDLAPTMLDQWSITRRQLAAFVGHQLGIRIKAFDITSGKTDFGLSRRLGVPVSLEFQDSARLLIAHDACDLVDVLTFERDTVALDRTFIERLADNARQRPDGGNQYQKSTAAREARKRRTALRDLCIQDAADEIMRDNQPKKMKKVAVADELLEDPRFENMSRGRLERRFVVRKK